jgi:oligosaccharyltransferase complex subunit beta
MKLLSLLAALLLLISVAFIQAKTISINNIALNVATPRTLILIDDNSLRASHTEFFDSLSNAGHSLTVAHVYEDIARLERYGEFFYENLIIFAPTAEELNEFISLEDVARFIDSGRSVLIASNNVISEPIREIADAQGIDIDEDNSYVIDSKSTVRENIIKIANISNIEPIVGDVDYYTTHPIYYRGTGHTLYDLALPTFASHRVNNIIARGVESTHSGPKGSKSGDKDNSAIQSEGSETLLVSGVQTENNARVTFVGSLDLFSNQFFAEKNSGNKRFASNLAQWTFHERGLIRAREIKHFVLNKPHDLNPESYRVGDIVQFNIILEQFNVAKRQWEPFTNSDVQIELIMIDPYIRTFLKHNNKGEYTLDLQVPDVYGVYKYVIDYTRRGWSYLQVVEQVSIHPYRHDEYDRFLLVAYPYYAAAFSCMIAFAIFGIVFLYSKE